MIPLDQVGASLPSGKVTRNSRSGGIPGNPVTQKSRREFPGILKIQFYLIDL